MAFTSRPTRRWLVCARAWSRLRTAVKAGPRDRRAAAAVVVVVWRGRGRNWRWSSRGRGRPRNGAAATGLSDEVCGVGITVRPVVGREGNPMSNEMGAPVRMQCVDRKPKRRGRPPKRLADDVGEQLSGLLPDEALQDALRGLDREQITGPGGLITQLA